MKSQLWLTDDQLISVVLEAKIAWCGPVNVTSDADAGTALLVAARRGAESFALPEDADLIKLSTVLLTGVAFGPPLAQLACAGDSREELRGPVLSYFKHVDGVLVDLFRSGNHTLCLVSSAEWEKHLTAMSDSWARANVDGYSLLVSRSGVRVPI